MGFLYELWRRGNGRFLQTMWHAGERSERRAGSGLHSAARRGCGSGLHSAARRGPRLPVAGAVPVKRKTSPLVLGSGHHPWDYSCSAPSAWWAPGLFIVHKVRQAGFDPELMRQNPRARHHQDDCQGQSGRGCV